MFREEAQTPCFLCTSMDLGQDRRMAEAEFFILLSNVEQERLEVVADEAIGRVYDVSDAQNGHETPSQASVA